MKVRELMNILDKMPAGAEISAQVSFEGELRYFMLGIEAVGVTEDKKEVYFALECCEAKLAKEDENDE